MNCSVNLTEESAKSYLSMISKMHTGDSDFYAWQVGLVKEVKVVSVKDIPEIENDVYKLIKRFDKKQCYQNAYRVASMIAGVEYVDGYIDVAGIQLEHAWNFYKGKYFDVTGELVLKREVAEDSYAMVMKYTSSQMHKLALETGMYGGYLKAFYKLFIKKEAA